VGCAGLRECPRVLTCDDHRQRTSSRIFGGDVFGAFWGGGEFSLCAFFLRFGRAARERITRLTAGTPPRIKSASAHRYRLRAGGIDAVIGDHRDGWWSTSRGWSGFVLLAFFR